METIKQNDFAKKIEDLYSMHNLIINIDESLLKQRNSIVSIKEYLRIIDTN